MLQSRRKLLGSRSLSGILFLYHSADLLTDHHNTLINTQIIHHHLPHVSLNSRGSSNGINKRYLYNDLIKDFFAFDTVQFLFGFLWILDKGNAGFVDPLYSRLWKNRWLRIPNFSLDYCRVVNSLVSQQPPTFLVVEEASNDANQPRTILSVIYPLRRFQALQIHSWWLLNLSLVGLIEGD